MTELILADIQTLEKQLPKLEKEAKRDARARPPSLRWQSVWLSG